MITIIAALTKNNVIGKDNKLLWHLPDDLKNFKRLTTNNTIIMGRKTFESIGKPLPNRHNIVISRSMQKKDGIEVHATIEQALESAQKLNKEIFIIGGAEIYKQTLKHADKMILSHVDMEMEGDAFFPEFNKKDWDIESAESHELFEVVTYIKKMQKSL